jgi:antitoxin component of MazEF toxin-antitoxin module
MRTRVARWGSSRAIRIPKIVAQESGLAPGTTVEMVKGEECEGC